MNHSVLLTLSFPEGVKVPTGIQLIPVGAGHSPESLAKLVADKNAEGVVIGAGQSVGPEFFAQAPKCLKVISTCSVGFDHLDVAAAGKNGVVVTNTPDVLTDCTADLAMMLLLNAARRGAEYLRVMEKGWRQPLGFDGLLGTSLSGKTLGIFGMGRIGQALADRARAFGMKIAYCNRHRLPAEKEKGAAFCPSLDELLPHSQMFALFAPGTKQTEKVMNKRTLGMLPKGAVFVNASRGSLVDEAALLASLRSGHIGAAGLDVFASEPNFNREFAELPQVFLTPHMGSATVETRRAMAERALGNVAAALAGRPAPDALKA
jgi:lactate dehydrogenase-like 2-hydroxyacid dehydrogenase